MNSRAEILSRIRAARPDVPGDELAGEIPIRRDYLRQRPAPEGLIARFCERVADYRAVVTQVPSSEVATAVTAALTAIGARRVALASGLPDPWLADSFDRVRDTPQEPLDTVGLQGIDAVVTGAACGIAETGTVVLDGGDRCGRRALTLVPDAHVCLVRAEDVVDDVPAAVALLDPRKPMTWISGPSATSDIELIRVEGVHGPRTLHVIVLGPDLSA